MPKRTMAARNKNLTPWGPAVFKGFPAFLNRWTGQPHEHKREIARNLRRAK